MAEVLFYHLTETTLDESLPSLLEKSLERGWRAVVQTGSVERRDELDARLWTWHEDAFLGHGTTDDPHPQYQPILLTTEQGNANGAQIRFLVDGAEPPPLSDYQRAVFMFDGHDASHLDQARAHWKIMKAEGHAVTYWQQTPERRWERKA